MTELGQITFEPQIPARFTIPEFEQMFATGIFEGSRVELVEGILVRMNVALPLHSRLQRQIFRKLDGIFGDGVNGRTAMFELGIELGDATLRAIDVAVCQENAGGSRYFGPADVLLAIEIANSTLRYDLNVKRADYALAGIPNYWVVDPDKRVIHVLGSPADDDYMARHLVKFGEALAVPGSDQSINITYPA